MNLKNLQLFISHSSADTQQASELATILKSQGLEPWLAKSEVPLGSNFAEEIMRAIKISDYFIVLLSKNSIASPHVKREVSIAVDKGIPLLPVVIGGAEEFINTMPEEWLYWLTVVQVVHFEDSSQTANEIIERIGRGSFDGHGLKVKTLSKTWNKWLLSLGVLALIASSSLFLANMGTSQESSVTVRQINPSPEESANKVVTESKINNPAISKDGKYLQEIKVRLNRNGPLTWSIVQKIEFPIGEIGKLQSSDFQCTLSVFPDLRSANFASDDRNYTTNAYYGWLDKDKYSKNYIIMTAVDGNTDCAKAASQAFSWNVKQFGDTTYLEPGATPFDKCLIAQTREYGGTRQDAIGPCKFQFERDGKAIPEQYLNLG